MIVHLLIATPLCGTVAYVHAGISLCNYCHSCGCTGKHLVCSSCCVASLMRPGPPPPSQLLHLWVWRSERGPGFEACHLGGLSTLNPPYPVLGGIKSCWSHKLAVGRSCCVAKETFAMKLAVVHAHTGRPSQLLSASALTPVYQLFRCAASQDNSASVPVDGLTWRVMKVQLKRTCTLASIRNFYFMLQESKKYLTQFLFFISSTAYTVFTYFQLGHSESDISWKM